MHTYYLKQTKKILKKLIIIKIEDTFEFKGWCLCGVHVYLKINQNNY